MTRSFRASLLGLTFACALNVATTQAQDMRVRQNNRAAVMDGMSQGSTSQTSIMRAFNQPLVIARYAPFAGKWAATIHVIRPSDYRSTTPSVRQFRPGDGAVWSTGTGSLRYYGGVNPFSAFQDNAADAALWGNSHASGHSFWGIQLAELMVVVGHAMRNANTSAGLIAAMKITADDTGYEQGGRLKTTNLFPTSRKASRTRTVAVSSVGQAATTWYVAAPEAVALTESLTGQYLVLGCQVANDPETRCVARAGVAFIPAEGTLATASSALPTATRYTVSSTAGTGSEFTNLMSRMGYANAAALQSTVSGAGQNGALMLPAMATSQLGEVTTGVSENRTYEDLVATTRTAATSSYSTAATWLTAAPIDAPLVNAVADAYGRRLATSCPGCATSGALPAGTTTAVGRVLDSQRITSSGQNGVNAIDGAVPTKKGVK